jgi:FkbM family methyltransferase
MMNFSAVSDRSLIGRVLRLPLRLIPSSATLPILQGRLRGQRWIVGSAEHGCWLGSYEYAKRVVIERTVMRGDVVFDVGANVGYYTLLTSLLAGKEGRVFAFEPVLKNLEYLQRHLRINRVANVTVIDKAVSDRDGSVSFVDGPSASMGHFAESGGYQVPTVAIDSLVECGDLPWPDFMKIDVEGAELLVLRGAKRTIEQARPVIALATDRFALHRDCCDFLRGLGYTLTPIGPASLDESEEILATP